MARPNRSYVCISCLPRLVLLAGGDGPAKAARRPRHPKFIEPETPHLFMHPRLIIRLTRT